MSKTMTTNYLYSSFDEFARSSSRLQHVTPPPAMLRMCSSTASTMSSVSTGTMISVAVTSSQPPQPKKLSSGGAGEVVTSWKDYSYVPANFVPKKKNKKQKIIIKSHEDNNKRSTMTLPSSVQNTPLPLEYQSSEEAFERLATKSLSYRSSCIHLDESTSNLKSWSSKWDESVRQLEFDSEDEDLVTTMIDDATLDDAFAVLAPSDDDDDTSLLSKRQRPRRNAIKVTTTRSITSSPITGGARISPRKSTTTATSAASSPGRKPVAKTFSALAQCRKNKRDLLLGKTDPTPEESRRLSHPSLANHDRSERFFRPNDLLLLQDQPVPSATPPSFPPSRRGVGRKYGGIRSSKRHTTEDTLIALPELPVPPSAAAAGKKSSSLSRQKHQEDFAKMAQQKTSRRSSLPSLIAYNDSHLSVTEEEKTSEMDSITSQEKFFSDISTITMDTYLRSAARRDTVIDDAEDMRSAARRDTVIEDAEDMAIAEAKRLSETQPPLRKLSSQDYSRYNFQEPDAMEKQQAIMDSILQEQNKMGRRRRALVDCDDEEDPPSLRSSSASGCSSESTSKKAPPSRTSSHDSGDNTPAAVLPGIANWMGQQQQEPAIFGAVQPMEEERPTLSHIRRSNLGRNGLHGESLCDNNSIQMMGNSTRMSTSSGLRGESLYDNSIQLMGNSRMSTSSTSSRLSHSSSNGGGRGSGMGRSIPEASVGNVLASPMSSSTTTGRLVHHKKPVAGDRLECCSGETVWVKGVQHCFQAIMQGKSTQLVKCMQCSDILQVPQATELVYCPDCGDVTPPVEATLQDVAIALETTSLDDAQAFLTSCYEKQQAQVADALQRAAVQATKTAMASGRHSFGL